MFLPTFLQPDRFASAEVPRPRGLPVSSKSPGTEGEDPVRGHPELILEPRAWDPKAQADSVSNEMSGRWDREATALRRKWLLDQASAICRNAVDAEDLVQETFMRFYQAFDKKEIPPNDRACEAWLAKTLVHFFYDQCRRRKVQLLGVLAEELDSHGERPVAQEAASPSVYDMITDSQIAQALQSLSPKLRATLELYLAGMKYEDIARALDIPIGTVGKRMHDAKVKLRGVLEVHYPAERH
jgi:RNA polymerase sigma-70 factor (ECF subfamily)